MTLERALVKRVLNFCAPRALHCCCVVSKLWQTTAVACAFSKERAFLDQLPSCTTGATESVRIELRHFLASKLIDERIEEWIPSVRVHTAITTRKQNLAPGCLHASLFVVSVTAPSQTKLERTVLVRCAHASRGDAVRDDLRQNCAALVSRICLNPPRSGQLSSSSVSSPYSASTGGKLKELKNTQQLLDTNVTSRGSQGFLFRPSAQAPRPAQQQPIPAREEKHEQDSANPAVAGITLELRELSARVDADLAQIKRLDLEFRAREGGAVVRVLCVCVCGATRTCSEQPPIRPAAQNTKMSWLPMPDVAYLRMSPTCRPKAGQEGRRAPSRGVRAGHGAQRPYPPHDRTAQTARGNPLHHRQLCAHQSIHQSRVRPAAG